MDDKILWDIIDGLRDELNIAQDGITDLNAEIKRLKGLLDMDSSLDDAIIKDAELIRELKAENKRLNDDYNNDHKVHNEYEDGLLAEIKTLQNKIEGLKSSDDVRKLRICRLKNDKLQAENVELKEGLSNEGVTMLQVDNKRLLDANKKRLNEIIELQAEIKAYINAREGRINTINDLNKINDRLVKQVSVNRDSNSNTHTHTISGEIAEYMSHNPKSKGARMFLLPRCDFKKDGEHDGGYFYWEDGME